MLRSQVVWCILFAAFAAFAGSAQAFTLAAGSTIGTRAWAQYQMVDDIAPQRLYSNTVQVTIAAVESITLSGASRFKAQAGEVVAIPYLLTNTGNTPSQINLSATNGGAGCGARAVDLSGLYFVLDTNNNGTQDSNEPAVASIRLDTGQVATVLLVGTASQVSTGTGCLAVGAVTVSQSFAANTNTTLLVDNGAALSITSTASYSGYLTTGSTIGYTVRALNKGVQSASPAATDAASVPTTIRVNGVAQRVLLLRNPVPPGTTYVGGSIRSGIPNALKLFRFPGDPPFNYRTVDDAMAIEVAVAEVAPDSMVPGGAMDMGFSVRVSSTANSAINSQGQAHYFDGNADATSLGNAVSLPVANQRIGVALAAGATVPQSAATGKVHMTAVVKNYSSTFLYDVQVHHPVESNAGPGSYTPSSSPGAGQYSVVAGSMAITQVSGSLSKPVPNAAFDGRAGGSDGLFGQAVEMGPGGSITVEYDLLINFTGWSAARTTQATASAARVSGAALALSDLSENGTDPDPTSAGPQNSNAPTRIEPMQMLSLQETVDSLTRVGNGQFDVTYLITVSNVGQTVAPKVRLVDNLACALSNAGVQSWTLTATPTTSRSLLLASGAFTGNAACNTAVDPSTGVPLAAALSLTDGTRDLAAGQTEQIRFTVRVTTRNTLTVVTNTVHAASLASDTGLVVAGTTTSALSMLADPQGIVYDSSTRQPLAGVLVTLSRGACSAGSTSAIRPAEVYNSELPIYTFNADGTLSMKTDATGQYQFYWQIPPIANLCSYSISVAPPPGYVNSIKYPSQSASFTSCGTVASKATAPQAGDPTTWYASFVSGFNPASGSVCEVVHNNIPLDPISSSMLLLQKEGDKRIAEFGDFLDYRLTLTNRSGSPLAGVSLQDVLPAGLAYVPDSTLLNGVRAANPSGGVAGKGPTLNFNYPAYRLAANASVVVQYRVRIGVGAPTEGDVINRATGHAGEISSNQASFKTYITGGAFSEEAYGVGKVFLDCNRNGVQDGAVEPGVPGVRLFMEDGSSVITDREGRWSLFGLKPLTHVVRLDASTLPMGAELQAWGNRNAGAPDSLFIDPRKGELVKANFPLTGCSDAVRAEVETRREALLTKTGQGEMDAAMNLRLASTLAATGLQKADVRGLAASGTLNGGAAAGGSMGSPTSNAMGALIALPKEAATFAPTGAEGVPLALASSGALSPHFKNPAGLLSPGADLLGPLVAPGTIGLETLIQEESPQLGFLDLKTNDTVLSNVLNIRVKGPLGTSLKLTVNSQEIPDTRVGKKLSLASRAIAAWEYIGVELKPGNNVLTVDAVDEFGVRRSSESLHIRAPGGLARLHLEAPAEPRADPLKPIKVSVRLTDEQGIPITARTQVTLEADQGAWLVENLNPSQPGVHVNIVGGQAELSFRPPPVPGYARLRVSANPLVEEVTVRFIPQDRPLLGIGLVEGVIDLSRRGALTLGQTPAGAAFEQEIQGAVDQQDGSRTSARAAFFFKGTILGQYLLTTSYDSHKQISDRLFRDIKPDQYYPVYGDSATRSYDAQSSGKLYLRIDSARSYLLLGDFNTASSEEVRKISQISRNLNGVKTTVERDNLRVTGYASRDSTAQQIEEIPATGVSFYFLSGSGSLVGGSEQVVVVTRLRNQPQVIVSTTTLVRGTDYTFEPLDKRLLLVQPVASFNADLNPQSIRVSYEVDSGGASFAVAGVDAQFKLGDRLQVGAVLAHDENPINPRDLRALTGLARVGDSTTVVGELAQSQTDLLGTGQAARLEVNYAQGSLKAQAQVQHTSLGFENPGAGIAGGNQQETYRAEYTLSPDLRMLAEGNHSTVQSNQAGVAAAEQYNLSLSMQRKFGPDWRGQVGLIQGTSSGAGPFSYGALGTDAQTGASTGPGAGTPAASPSRNTLLVVGLEAKVPDMPRLQLSGQISQDLSASDQRTAMLGASYALTDKTRLYARSDSLHATAIDSALNGGRPTQSTRIGVESAYMEGGRFYSETRLGDSGNRNASGVRNAFQVNDAVSLTASAEHTSDGTALSGDSKALAFGATYSAGHWRASGAAEWHSQSDGSSSSLYSLGAAYKLGSDWAVLGRSIHTLTSSPTAGSHLMAREQLGLAWRPASRDDINGLLRMEHRREDIRLGTDALPGSGGNAFTGTGGVTLPGNYQSQIFTALANYNPSRSVTLTGRYAAKRTTYTDDGGSGSYWAQLLHTRVTQDLSEKWDVGLQLGALQGQGGALQSTAGIEVGYQLFRNAWLSAGYNFIGLKDADLASNDYTNAGAYIRLRVKFDEHGIGSSDTPATPRLRELGQAVPCVACESPNTGTGMGRAAAEQPPSAAPASSPANGAGHAYWSAGQPLGNAVVLPVTQLFDVRAANAVLTAQGRGLMSALGAQILATGVPDILISVGHGSNVAWQEKLWLSRTASLRRAINAATGIRNMIRIRVDTQPYAAPGAPVSGGEPAVFTLAVLDEAAPPVLAGENK